MKTTQELEMKDTLFTTSILTVAQDLSSEFFIFTKKLSALEQPLEFSVSKRCNYLENRLQSKEILVVFNFSITLRKST